MYQTGVFIPDPTGFSEKDWEKDTAIFMKLVNDLSESRWESFYSNLRIITKVSEEMEEISMANADPLQDKPEHYRIQDSDPIIPGEDADLE